MLFNGKYYNKPGHLGMTRQELKEAIQGAVDNNLVDVDNLVPNIELSVADVLTLISTGYINDVTVTGLTGNPYPDYIIVSAEELGTSKFRFADFKTMPRYDYLFYDVDTSKIYYEFLVLNTLSDGTITASFRIETLT